MLRRPATSCSAADRQAIEGAVERLKKAIENNDRPPSSGPRTADGRAAQGRRSRSSREHSARSLRRDTEPGPGRRGEEGGEVIDAEVVDDDKR